MDLQASFNPKVNKEEISHKRSIMQMCGIHLLYLGKHKKKYRLSWSLNLLVAIWLVIIATN